MTAAWRRTAANLASDRSWWPPRLGQRGARTEAAGLVFAVASAGAYGASTVVVKLAFEYELNVGTTVAARLAIAATLLWAFVLAARIPRRIDRRKRIALLLLGAGTAAPWLLSTLALTRLSANTAGLLLFTYPAMVTVLEIAFGRQPYGLNRVTAILAGLAGVVLLLGAPTTPPDAAGVTLALGAALSLAVYLLIADRVIPGVHPLVCSAYIMTGGGALVVAGCLAVRQLRLPGGLAPWGILVLTGVISSVGIALFLPAMTRIGVTLASIAGNLQPVVTVLLAVPVLSERLSGVQVLGAGLIVGSIGMLPLLRRRDPTGVELQPDPARAVTGRRAPARPPGRDP